MPLSLEAIAAGVGGIAGRLRDRMFQKEPFAVEYENGRLVSEVNQALAKALVYKQMRQRKDREAEQMGAAACGTARMRPHPLTGVAGS